MRQVIVYNKSDPQVKPIRVVYCSSFFCRLRGLTFRSHLSPDEGLLLVQPRDSRLDTAVHMVGVWLDLAVVWINSAGIVVDSCLARRWRLAYVPRRPARFVLEMAPVHLLDFKVGDEVRFEEKPLD